MLRHNVIHPLHQIKAFKRDMSATFLEIANGEQIVLKDLLMRIVANKIHEPDNFAVLTLASVSAMTSSGL